jgi:hypothetical protein
LLNYYIYYRVQPEHSAAAEAAVKHIQSEIAARCGITGRVLKKRDETNLWMEIYEQVESAAFEDILAAAENKSGIAALLDGARHKECFNA